MYLTKEKNIAFTQSGAYCQNEREEISSNEPISKTKLASTFASAVASYSLGNVPQRVTAKWMLAHLNNISKGGARYTNCLDLGCGGGVNVAALQQIAQRVLGVDLTDKSLRAAYQVASKNPQSTNRFAAVQADAEYLPFLADSFDLVFSNLMLQWCESPDLVIQNVIRILRKGGYAVLSTLLPGTLQEIEDSWQAVSTDKHIRQFLPIDKVFDESKLNKKVNLSIKKQDVIVYEETVKGHFCNLKHIGANYVPSRKNKGLMAKSKWQGMCNQYEKQRDKDSGMLPLTYKVAYIIIQK